MVTQDAFTQLFSKIERIDEKTSNIQSDITELRSDLRSVSDKLKTSEDKLDSKINNLNIKYVEKVEFEPVKRFVYGIIMFVFISVVGGGLTLVIQTKAPPHNAAKAASSITETQR